MAAAGNTAVTVAVTLGIQNTNLFSMPAGIDPASWSKVSGLSWATPCRLYMPLYTFSSTEEAKYISECGGVKEVRYLDVISYQLKGAAGSFDYLITNGIVNLKRVILVPFLSASAAAAPSGGQSVSPYLSPFWCSSRPSPCPITNFQIRVAGLNLFPNGPENYTYEQFLEQIAPATLNGGLTQGLSAGLYSIADFENSPYYVGDCSRIPGSEQGAPRSVQIQGQILGPNVYDFIVSMELEKSIKVDVPTGAIVQQG